MDSNMEPAAGTGTTREESVVMMTDHNGIQPLDAVEVKGEISEREDTCYKRASMQRSQI